MVHYWSDGPSSQFRNQHNFTNLLLHQRDHGMLADWNFFATSHGKGENDGAGGDVKNAVWRNVLQNKAVAGNLESFVSVAKEKFPNFAIEGFKPNEICDVTKHLLERYKKHSKNLPSTYKFHLVAIENKKVVGYFLTKTCPCHHQIEQNQEKAKSDAVAQTVDTEESISPTVGQFYKVIHSFLDGKGGEVVQVLPVMYSKNDLEEHLFTFLKSIQQNNYFLKACVRYFLSNFISHQMIALQKLRKKFFISTKKLFSFWRYSKFCISVFPSFSPCQPQLARLIED